MAKNDYFLEPDDAQTFGNIDYMKKRTKIKRTFPKTIRNKDGFAVEIEVASVEDRTPASDGFQSIPDYLKPDNESSFSSTTNGLSNNSNGSSTSFTTSSNSKTDTNMDMFLKMARTIKKRR